MRGRWVLEGALVAGAALGVASVPLLGSCGGDKGVARWVWQARPTIGFLGWRALQPQAAGGVGVGG